MSKFVKYVLRPHWVCYLWVSTHTVGHGFCEIETGEPLRQEAPPTCDVSTNRKMTGWRRTGCCRLGQFSQRQVNVDRDWMAASDSRWPCRDGEGNRSIPSVRETGVQTDAKVQGEINMSMSSLLTTRSQRIFNFKLLRVANAVSLSFNRLCSFSFAIETFTFWPLPRLLSISIFPRLMSMSATSYQEQSDNIKSVRIRILNQILYILAEPKCFLFSFWNK